MNIDSSTEGLNLSSYGDDIAWLALGPRPAAACSLHRSFGVYRTTERLGFRALQALRGTDVDVDEPQSSEHPLPPPHT